MRFLTSFIMNRYMQKLSQIIKDEVVD